MTINYNYLASTSDKDLAIFYEDYRDNYSAQNKPISEMANDYALSINETRDLMLAGAKVFERNKAKLTNKN